MKGRIGIFCRYCEKSLSSVSLIEGIDSIDKVLAEGQSHYKTIAVLLNKWLEMFSVSKIWICKRKEGRIRIELMKPWFDSMEDSLRIRIFNFCGPELPNRQKRWIHICMLYDKYNRRFIGLEALREKVQEFRNSLIVIHNRFCSNILYSEIAIMKLRELPSTKCLCQKCRKDVRMTFNFLENLSKTNEEEIKRERDWKEFCKKAETEAKQRRK